MGDAFLRALSADLEQTQRALSPHCLFCVPQPSSLHANDALTQDVLYTHVLTLADTDPYPKRPLGAYDTLNGKQGTITGSHIHTGKGFRAQRQVRILLSEKREICHQEITVLHLSRPLEGGLDVPDDPSELDVATLRKYTAIMRSFPENELVFHQLDVTIGQVHKLCAHEQVYDQHKQTLSTNLREEWETAVLELVSAGSFDDVDESKRLQTRHGAEASHLLQIQQVVECYLMENLHDVIFPKVVASCQEQDLKLHQVLYRLRHYTPEDFGLKEEFQCYAADARDTLLAVTQKKTPLEMLLVFKKCIDQITNAITQNIKLRNLNFEAYQLTTDDILDQLLVVLVQTFNKVQRKKMGKDLGPAGPFCIVAVLQYISDYHFINSSTTALGFTLANFQVAIEYLIMRADHKDDFPVCVSTGVEIDCSLTIKESKCICAARKLRRDLTMVAETVGRARKKINEEDLHVINSKSNHIDQNDSTIRRVCIVGDWSASAEGNGVEERHDTVIAPLGALSIHPVVSGVGEERNVTGDISAAQLSGGQRFFAIVTEDGSLFTWGDSSGGRLGYTLADGDSRRASIPRRVVALQQYSIVQVACGAFHSLATDINGHVFAWGSNSRGQLGFLSSEAPFGAVEMPSVLEDLRGSYISSVACGEYHSLALAADGRVYSWGCNKFGQLGRAANGLIQQAQPSQIDADWMGWALDMKSRIGCKESYIVRRIAAGKDHSLATSCDGAAFTWGRGDSGQLGHGCYANVSEPKQVMAITSIISERCGVTDVAGGNHFSLFLLQNGSVCICGVDPSMETDEPYLSPTLLALPLTLELEFFGQITALSCGEAHYALLSKRGSLLLSNSNASNPSSDAKSTSDVQERRVVWLKEAGTVCRMVCGASHTLFV